VEDAIARLIRIAKADTDILTEPEPFVTFEDFGDNALVLWLRCYALKDYLLIATRLRREIYRDFNEAGIGIAFPQRDVHLDASEPLPIRILRDDPDPARDGTP
jgi:potassium efflux system protein